MEVWAGKTSNSKKQSKHVLGKSSPIPSNSFQSSRFILFIGINAFSKTHHKDVFPDAHNFHSLTNYAA